MEFEDLTQKALRILLKNLDLYPSFDSNKPYDEKNQYFLEVSQLSEPLFRSDILIIPAEKYYKVMLGAILKYESENHKSFNKGIVYANLGIAQIANGNLDEGIHHLLIADREDLVFVVNTHGILESELWRQFEKLYVIANLIELNENVNTGLHFQITESFIQSMFRNMLLQDRLFLESTIWNIYRNLNFNQQNPNDYTRGRLLSGLKDLCLLGESLLRKRQRSQNLISLNSQIMLGDLLSNALQSRGIGYPHNRLRIGANTLSEFLENLEEILQSSASPEIRRVYCFRLVRNFTGHHFEISSHVKSPQGREFFEMYEEIFVNILTTMLYLAHESLI